MMMILERGQETKSAVEVTMTSKQRATIPDHTTYFLSFERHECVDKECRGRKALHDISINIGGPIVTHIFFADDSLLFS
jgi:hypothetical protein